MTLAPGHKLAHYEIVAPIGKGGMGEVYRARDTKLDREVAIKVLPEEFAQDEERLARFQREAKLLASLNHPNIAGIHGFEDSDDVKALVLELVEGPTLAERIEQGPIPVDEAIAIAKQIAEALEAGHDAGVIHRDLKPANIKLKEDGTVKVLDYGLAKALEGEAPAGADSELSQSPTLTRQGTEIGVILGTAAYMSPEQAKGKRVDKRTDIWAFGAVLYEMLTGTKPFRGDDVSDILAAVLREEPAWDVLPAQAPAALGELLRLCLTKSTSERLASIHDARLVLDGAFSRPARATDDEPQKQRVLSIVGPLVAAALAALGTWFAVSTHHEEPTKSIRRFSLSMDTRNNMLDGPAISPDGTMVAFANLGRMWIRHMNDLDAKPVPDSVGASHPFWSSDSRDLGFMVEKTLLVWGAAEGRTTELAALPANFFLGATWSANGTIVISLAEAGLGAMLLGDLYRISERGGPVAVHRHADPDAGELGFASPRFLPDGETLAYAVGRSDGSFELVVERDGSENVTVIESWTQQLERAPSFDYAATGHLVFDTSSGLMAQSFSPDALRLAGEPFVIAPGASAPSAAGDGTLVYKSSTGAGGRHRLAWLDRGGRISGQTGGSHGVSIKDVALSPDGKRIAYSDLTDVYVYDIARDTTQRVSFGDAVDNYATWSSDGREILFSSTRSGGWDFYAKAADGSSTARALNTGPALDWNPRWSYDGRFVVYHAIGPETAGRDILYIDMKGDPVPRTFLATDHHEGAPSLSPDNRFVAYQSDESGRLEVYVRPFPHGDGKWLVSVDGGHKPLWSRAGNELFFVQANKLMVTDVSTQSGFTSNTPRLVADSSEVGFVLGINPWSMFNPLNYDVTADGEKVLVVQNAGGSNEEVTIVENWAAIAPARSPE